MRYIIGSLAGVSTLALALTGCATQAQPDKQDAPGDISWSSCADFAANVEEVYEAIDMPSPLANSADRMECGTLEVPLDYDDPHGKQITIAVSKLNPSQKSKGYILTNPGGPGLEGRTLPAVLADSEMKALTDEYTLVGVDMRGTGGSTTVLCDDPFVDDDPEAEVPVTEASALAYAERLAAGNTACVESDPAYFEQLTTQNAAHDLDRVREGLGAEKVSYYGTSWGTELGIAYLEAFPERVERMLLDSVMDVRGNITDALDDVAAAVAQQPDAPSDGGEGEAGAGDDSLSAEGAYSPGNFVTRTAMTCNVFGPTDAASVWADHVARTERLGSDIETRTQHPVSGVLPGSAACAGWPFEGKPVQLSGQKFENLQLVVHSGETVTPPAWGEYAHEQLGGHLAVVDDDAHGSLSYSEKAGAAVKFLTTGTPMP